MKTSLLIAKAAILFIILSPSAAGAAPRPNDTDSLFFERSMTLYDSLLSPSFDRMYRELLRQTRSAGNERYHITTRRMLVSRLSVLKDIEGFVRESDGVVRLCQESGSDIATSLLYEVWNFKADRLRSWGMQEAALETAQQMSDYAQKHRHLKGNAMAQYLFGRMYLNNHQLCEAENHLAKAWRICLDNGFSELATRVGFSMIAVRMNREEYDAGLSLADSIRAIVADRQAKGEKTSPVTLLKLADKTCSLLTLTGDLTGAAAQRASMHRWLEESGDSSQTGEVLRVDCRFLIESGDYDRACEVLNTLVDMGLRSGNWSETANSLYARADVKQRQKRYAEAVEDFKMYAEAKDSAAVMAVNSQLNHLTKKYELNELQWAARQARYHFALALCALALALLVIGFYIFHTRALHRKNKALYEKVGEADQAREAKNAMAAEDDMSPLALIYSNVTDAMQKEKLFLNPDLNRESLATFAGTNSKYLTDAIKAYSDGQTVGEFTNGWRLREAARLLRSTPDVPSIEIGEMSGFGSTQTFYRLFKEHFGMTPAEYRKASSSQTSSSTFSSFL